MIYSMSKVKYIFTEWPTAIAKMFSIEYEVIVTNYLKTLSNLCSKYFLGLGILIFFFYTSAK